MYLPEKKWTQTDGNFGVIIGVTNKKTNDWFIGENEVRR
jgi:hypothetical protein